MSTSKREDLTALLAAQVTIALSAGRHQYGGRDEEVSGKIRTW